MINPTIVVIAFDREKSLKRLLESLSNANFPSKSITLHISIDGSKNSKVKDVADTFQWVFGEKIIELKSENLGLVQHVLECGKLTEKYESIIVLEDDLVVAPNFYSYAEKANSFYQKDDKIAGTSLYTYSSEENNFYPFEPIKGNSDVHFIQVASSWGQIWNRNQWSKFSEWLVDNPEGDSVLLPNYISKWNASSWKKLFINYMISTDRYFVFPNDSFSTNFEDLGTNATKTGLFQVQMINSLNDLRFCEFSESNAVYDVYFELKPNCIKKLNSLLLDFDFDVDLYGSKPFHFSSNELILTTRRGDNPKVSFGSEMKPLYQNIEYNIEGNDIGIYPKASLLCSDKSQYLSLVTPSVRIDQYKELKKGDLDKVTLIIPVPSNQVEKLKNTISTLATDRLYNVQISIATSKKVLTEVQGIVKESDQSISVLSFEVDSLDELAICGINASKTAYCGWMQAGMLIDLGKLEDVAKIFGGMKQLQIIQGVQENVSEESYIKVNTSKYRWTTKLANLYPEKATLLRSEMIFWRKSLIANIDTALHGNLGALYIELLKRNPIYVAAIKIGDYNNVKHSFQIETADLKSRLIDSQYQPKKGINRLVRPIYKFWFLLNIPMLRLFYKENEKLPLVIRYDYQNNSYYLDNY